MITQSKIAEVEPLVKVAVDELFALAKVNEKVKNDYILFLSKSKFSKKMIGTVQMTGPSKISPYITDSKIEDYKDVDRMNFYVNYLNSNAALQLPNIPGEKKSEFFKFNTTIEIMIYSHVWEASQILTILKHLANLTESKAYEWKLELPEFSRHEFIRKEIRDVFQRMRLKIADLITDSYHSQIRNAFAHSDYSFGGSGEFENDILLWNYKEQNSGWQRRGLKFDEWDTRFAITISIAHYLVEKFFNERQSLGANTFKVYTPDFTNNDNLKSVYLQYRPEHDMFNYLQGSRGAV